MDIGESFIGPIRENPDSDELRLAYARWLKSKGDPYGEFIEIQCRLASSSSAEPGYSDWLEAEQRLRVPRI